MSDKIAKQLQNKPKKIELDNAQFNYMNTLETIQQSFDYYMNQAKTEFLQMIALKNGYTAADNIQLSIDLKSEDHLLTVSKI